MNAWNKWYLFDFRVLELEKKKENVNSKAKECENISTSAKAMNRKSIQRNERQEIESSDDEGADDIDEYLDWRSKKAYK